MTEQDREAFAEVIQGVYELYGRTIGVKGLQLWWTQLVRYELPKIKEAIDRHLGDSEQSRRLPVPYDLLAQLRQHRRIDESAKRRDFIKRADPDRAAVFVAEALEKLKIHPPKTKEAATHDKPTD